MWETNRAQKDYVARNANTMILSTDVVNSYVAFPENAGLWSSVTREREDAYPKVAEEFTRRAALREHGNNPWKGDSFDRDAFEGSLEYSVRCVFSALRACITAIRCKSTYAYFPDENKFRVYCDLGNVADEALQVKAIRLALDMCPKAASDPRKPTKIVVVITDAPPDDPDSKGNTQASIADYAERVDPAHIYPIVVGRDPLAHSKAAALAKLTGGEVLTAKSGDEVASVLATAVEKAMAAHGAKGAQVPPWMLFYGGLIASAAGGLWIWRDRKKRARP